MKKILHIFWVLFFIVTSVDGSTFDLNAKCKEAYQEVFHLNFKKAEKILLEEKKENPDNAAIYYVQHYIDFLRAFISEEPAEVERLKKNTDIFLKEIEKVDSESQWKNLARGEMLLRLAIIKLKYKEYLSSGFYIRKSFKLLEANQQQFPQFSPNLKTLGFFHAVIGSVPENYKWLANLAGMKGTISQGSKELNLMLQTTEHNDQYRFMFDEVLFLKIFIATHLEKNPAEGISLAEKYSSEINRQGALHTFIEANTLVSSGKYDDALKVLQSFQQAPSSYPVYYLEYMKGMLLLNKLDHSAEACFRKYVDNYIGNSFLKSAWHKIAWLKLVQGDEKGYRKNLEMVLTVGNDFTDEDKQALKEALSNEIPNVILLKSRLLFDGGNFNRALAELAGKPTSEFPNLKDQIEFTYRLARIFDKKGQPDKAIQYYTSTYENGKLREWYFSANAALLLGNLYEDKGDKKTAAEWYKKCLALRNHEYQNSIDQKAEAGLNRLQ